MLPQIMFVIKDVITDCIVGISFPEYLASLQRGQGSKPLPPQNNGLFQKKIKHGGFRTHFLEPRLEYLGYLLYPWKFQTKQGFTPRNSTKLPDTAWKL